jgi:hypothetical protein
MRMRMGAFRNILRQDVGYFDDARHSTGKICTRLATDAPNIRAVSICCNHDWGWGDQAFYSKLLLCN